MARKKRKGGSDLNAEAEATRSDLTPKCKMSNRRGNNSGGPSSTAPNTLVKRYTAPDSLQRLMEKGLHIKVSKASPQKEIDLWYAVKKDSAKYREGNLPSFGQYTDAKSLVKTVKITNLELHQRQYPIRGMFSGLQLHGQIMGEHLASSGIPNLVNFAKAYPEGWAGLSQGMAIWDVSIRDFRGNASGYVFLAVTPKVSYGEFMRNSDFSKNRDLDRIEMNNCISLISTIHRECGPSTPFWVNAQEEPEVPLLSRQEIAEMDEDAQEEYRDAVLLRAAHVWHGMIWGQKLVQKVKSLPHVQGIAEQLATLVDPAESQAYCMSRQLAFSSTFTTLAAICNRRLTLRVLHFHATPLLDRRVVAIVARGCPKLKMLGIYDCPDLHVGDTICLLDLIHEINSSRSQDQPRIQALDFYPRYNTGPLLEQVAPGNDARTYGLSWKKFKMDVQQRGLFGILLQVVLKAKRMNTQLLMDRDCAFMTYLSRLPFAPLQIFGFLDGLYRYLDLMASRSKDQNAIKQALYDITKPVRMGLASLDKDWPHFYIHEMGKTMMFCSSCGYEYLQDFFTESAQRARSHTKLCAACTLRMWLDEEIDNGKRDGKEIWEPFFPDWKRTEFNADAPLHQHGKDLVQLKSTEEVRPFPPSTQILPNGDMFRPPWTEPLVRDNKIHNDSLQSLPTLRELFDREVFELAMSRAKVIDTRKMVDVLLKDFYPHAEDGIPAYKDVAPDFGSQGPERTNKDMYLAAHSFESAALFFETLQHKPFQDLKAHRNANEYNPTGFW